MNEQRYPEPTVGALILGPEGKLFLMQSHKWRDKYVIPGGHIELGESAVNVRRNGDLGWHRTGSGGPSPGPFSLLRTSG